jgi:hypothetical protein
MSSARPAARGARWALAVVVALLFGLVTWRSVEPDYALHALWSRELAEHGRIPVPHPLFHLLTVAVDALLLAPVWDDGSRVVAALLVGTASYVALALVLHRRLLGDGGEEEAGGGTQAWTSAGWTLSLMLVAPITLLTWHAHQLYLGYIAPNVFHNPTVALLKPLALAWFWAVARPGGASARGWAGAALLAGSATLAKPSFTVAFVPALVLWLCLARLLPRATAGGAALVSVVVGGAILACQAWARGSQASLVGFHPLEVMGFYAARWQMPLFFLLSTAFPLCLTLSRWSEARRSGPLMLAWLVFGIGAAYGYLLAEAEPNTGDGNWLWSGQVALFVLFAESVRLFRSGTTDRTPGGRRQHTCAVVFALHLACGLLWYAAEVAQPHGWWFPFPGSAE